MTELPPSPRPWHAEPPEVSSRPGFTIFAADGSVVAEHLREADVPLVTHAPDLLEALEACEPDFAQAAIASPTGSAGQLLKVVRAAVAQAKGDA